MIGYLRRNGHHVPDQPDYLHYPQARPRGRAYYAFVEEADAVGVSAFLDRPDGTAMDIDSQQVVAGARFRFRCSGLQVEEFHDIADFFEELDPETVSPSQRDRRKADLQQYLAGIRLPVLDLYVPDGHPDLRTLRSMLRQGSWHVMRISRKRLLEPPCPVLVGDPAAREGGSGVFYLSYAGAAPVDMEMRLRDIFSLAHIRDAEFGFEEETGGGGTRPPRKPHGFYRGPRRDDDGADDQRGDRHASRQNRGI